MTEEQIKHLVDRFLGWTLPEGFKPDNGIRYTPPHGCWSSPPTGTNLFDATQADAMVRHMVKGASALAWQSITTLPDSDDVVWLCKVASRTVDGPRAPYQGDVDDYDLWAPCQSPSLPQPK